MLRENVVSFEWTKKSTNFFESVDDVQAPFFFPLFRLLLFHVRRLRALEFLLDAIPHDPNPALLRYPLTIVNSFRSLPPPSSQIL